MTGDTPISGNLDTFPKLLAENARVRGDKPASREKDFGIWLSWTWGQVAEEVRAIACGLAALGVKRGDEIVRPGSGEQVPDGDIGEVIVTSLNREYPLIRFATGDLSSVMPGQSPCGRTGMRLTGWKGRADQAAKVKGMFVTPSQIAEVLKRHPKVAKARLIIDQKDAKDVMTLLCEAMGEAGGDDPLGVTVAKTLKGLTSLKGAVRLVPPGSLPNDGLVIEDKRSRD